MKPIYYYDTHIMSFNEETVKEYLSSMNLSKNNIDANVGILYTFDDLLDYCNMYGYEVREIEPSFGISLEEWFK